MKNNLLVILVASMFLAMGIGSAFAQSAVVEKSAVKAIEKTACCAADGLACKEKCTCKDCKGDGKCDEKCACCCKDGMKACTDKDKCKDGKGNCKDMNGCGGKKAEVKKADCGATQGCSGAMKPGCGMMKK